ncbi:MAG: polysaccharide deacetylase family protein [Spirochaetales bacterium]|nr:polysaccharide deacetylase family protein [Spirochaetales bacterium]
MSIRIKTGQIIIFILMACFYSYGETSTSFGNMDLSSRNLLLFELKTESPGVGNYNTLFLSNLNKKNMTQLSFFPENIMYLSDTGQFQIQNRFGVFRTDENLKNLTSLDLFTSFLSNYQISKGKIYPIQASPDGKYLVYIKNPVHGYGDLTLFDIGANKEYSISGGIELTIDQPVALWSNEGDFVVYSKKGELYYYSIEHLKENRVFSESLRKIGKGVLQNIRWGENNTLYYVSGQLVYKIASREFFTRAFYKDILRIGVILGKIPFDYDPNFDSFWISPDGNKILFSKEGRNLFFYFLKTEDYLSTGEVKSLPYLYLPSNTKIAKVIWSKSDKVTILTQSMIKGSREKSIYRMTIPTEGKITGFVQADDKNVVDMELSPSEEFIAVITSSGLVIKDYEKWTEKKTHSHPSPLKAIYKSDNEIILAGNYYTELYNSESGETAIICVSQPAQFGFSEAEDKIVIQVGNQYYTKNLAEDGWASVASFSAKQSSVASPSYRVYKAELADSGFENMIMVRNIKVDTYGTTPLFETKDLVKYEAFPEEDETIDFNIFNHGSRIRRREVAIAFNLIDSIKGLNHILNVLSDYNLKCTFFINGEAIKRYPGAVKEVVASGHEIASLFYSYFNMTDSKYDLDKEFIKLGLAINEDDFYGATGKDLDLLWHAPHYFVNTPIINASKEMGYTYVGRDIDPLDWVTESDSNVKGALYLSSVELVGKIMKEKKPGSIIPLMVGTPEGKRQDYLFQKLDLLINELIGQGYEISKVSTLIDHAK